MEEVKMRNIWFCKVGEVQDTRRLPEGADAPMRNAISEAFRRITGDWPDFLLSGWSGELTEVERAVVEGRPPSEEYERSWKERHSLRRFYSVRTDEELISAMLHHIEKLQTKVEDDDQPAINQVREG